jgi:hypothetical protein
LDEVADFVEVRGEQTDGRTVLGLSSVESHTGEILPDGQGPVSGKCFRSGDILFGRLRPYLNKVAVVTEDGICSPEFYVLRPKEGIDAEFLALALRSPFVLGQVRHMTTGNTHPRVAEDDAKGLLVPVPEAAVRHDLVTRMKARRVEAMRLRQEGQAALQSALEAFGKALLG